MLRTVMNITPHRAPGVGQWSGVSKKDLSEGGGDGQRSGDAAERQRLGPGLRIRL